MSGETSGGHDFDAFLASATAQEQSNRENLRLAEEIAHDLITFSHETGSQSLETMEVVRLSLVLARVEDVIAPENQDAKRQEILIKMLTQGESVAAIELYKGYTGVAVAGDETQFAAIESTPVLDEMRAVQEEARIEITGMITRVAHALDIPYDEINNRIQVQIVEGFLFVAQYEYAPVQTQEARENLHILINKQGADQGWHEIVETLFTNVPEA